ncbi:phosphopyruvate hydratase [Candidatus Saccharibacteria bacterium]|nr:phosphopyruvate hydratase [Candidatus Saccharibacteria bacterium]
MKITDIKALQILDSRGTPTIEVLMTSSTGNSVRYSVPAGASKGEHEAHELRDGGTDYSGQAVTKAVHLIETDIRDRLLSQTILGQKEFDSHLAELDPSSNKEKLGGNTTLALSAAYLRLSALDRNLPIWKHVGEMFHTEAKFPRLFANLINGGKHAPGLDIQEFMIVPTTNLPSQAAAEISAVYAALQKALAETFGPSAKLTGDEGGMAPIGPKSTDILDEFVRIKKELQLDYDIALDVAASSFYSDGHYQFEGTNLKPSEWITRLSALAQKYSIYSVEDPAAEGDRSGFAQASQLENGYLVIGDDISVTDPDRIAELAQSELIDGVIIKPNQIGTISQTFDAIVAARRGGLKVILSHRSGETNDATIADIAYGVAADGIKLGAPRRGERVAKYNRLLEIERGID